MKTIKIIDKRLLREYLIEADNELAIDVMKGNHATTVLAGHEFIDLLKGYEGWKTHLTVSNFGRTEDVLGVGIEGYLAPAVAVYKVAEVAPNEAIFIGNPGFMGYGPGLVRMIIENNDNNQ